MTAAAHLERSRYHRGLADEFAPAHPRFPDWEIVIRFYAAVHLLQAYLLTKNARFHVETHADRFRAIDASPELVKNRNFRRAYSLLRDLSERVRYDAGFVTAPLHIDAARVHLELVERVLVPKIEAFIAK
jgi:hypothetical protein